jgi:hypothetical protein
MSAFIDDEGAFDTFDSIRAAAKRRHIEPEKVEWIKIGNVASNNYDYQRLPPKGCLSHVL